MSVFTNVIGTPANPQFAEVLIKGKDTASGVNTRQFVQVYHMRRTAGTGPLIPATLAANVALALGPAMNAALSVDYEGDKVSVRPMDDPTVTAYENTFSYDGAVSDDRLPNFNAVCIPLKTDGRGRNYRGSKHFGPIAESHTTEDQLNGTGQPLWNDVAAAIYGLQAIDGGNGTQWSLIILSTTLSDLTANPSSFTGADINGAADFVANKNIGTMRRRKLKQV